MNEDIKDGCFFLGLGIITLFWLIYGKPKHPLKYYFLSGYILGIVSILAGIYLIISALLN